MCSLSILVSPPLRSVCLVSANGLVVPACSACRNGVSPYVYMGSGISMANDDVAPQGPVDAQLANWVAGSRKPGLRALAPKDPLQRCGLRAQKQCSELHTTLKQRLAESVGLVQGPEV